ncbi:Uncharacterized protein OS=Singulisphaera acidiphila (strain ATCC BAA-1392 / DSM 18658 / VKM B-2454 / MOB10) GN=Sinac_1105 PE=4 SV=1 [Gemmata massiliana]|uniref:Uncharacterized protein n=1 Tax=Gemmata massiliana TaxID=1210884 RepID=A0A6P2DJG2_9BACT|nr:hypothetical protein [Gemmata massiliana]VTS02234.1 Uncharacterized protein OS=Singulisphaera acidiphila (strain ATCC BAA-1392 / DSM 18658 / VKM B-2454 / MOB10) GN=Sinac_1105 PE=4 SV=1 [Gemmata massiliana]
MPRYALPVPTIAILLAAPLFAAPVPPAPKGDDPVVPSAAKLLQNRKVQKELKMTAEQRIVVLDGLADLDEEYEKKFEQLSRAPNPAEDAYDKLDKERKQGVDRLLTEVATKSLTSAQRKRLAQLDRRVQGIGAFNDPRVQSVLQLTDAQKKKIAELVERQKSELTRYFDNLGNEDDMKRKSDLLEFRKDMLKQMEGVLTADQKTGWAVLLGEAATGFVPDELWIKMEDEMDLPLPGIAK